MAFIKMYRQYLTITAIAWAACLVLFVAAYLTLLRPQTNSTRNLRNKLTEKKRLYESAQRAAHEQTVIRLNEEIERLRDRVKDFVIDFEDSANLTFDIGQIANDKKVTSFSVKSQKKRRALPTSVPDSNCVDENHLDISFTAGFNQFATFVNALERHRPVLFLHEFAITRSSKNDLLYQVTLDVAALVRKQQDKETADRTSAEVYSAKK
jgi:Tfp pilus assembly protein PilO